MNGKWIAVNPTDCFTAVPIYQCSACKDIYSGYEPDLICIKCGSRNKIDIHKSVSLPIFGMCDEI
ncbi:MAG: hypothetical protein II304_04310 [Bacteroidales bacterium]|nr:hypothetical protein [Bacteroidales bacterium]